jgi:hypothetical protein
MWSLRGPTCFPRRHYIVCLPAWSQTIPSTYLVSTWSLSGPYLVPIWSLPNSYLVPTWSVWSNMLPMLSLFGPHVVLTCSACSLLGLYLVLFFLVPIWSLKGHYLVHLQALWTLRGLTGTFMVPTLSLIGCLCCLHMFCMIPT